MKDTMLAAIFTGHELVLSTVPVPELRDINAAKKYDKERVLLSENDLVLLQVLGASICGTDLHILAGEHGSHPPVILGHEYVGRVIEIGKSVRHVQVGDFVAVDPNVKCGYCRFCREGSSNMCTNLTTLGIFIDGGFAEYNLAPAKQLYRLPSDLPLERAIFFEPLTCVMHGLQTLKPMTQDRVLIFGAGPIGCYFAMLCRLNGVNEIMVVEPNKFRRNFLTELDYEVVISHTEVREDYFDIVIDACGVAAIVPQTFGYASRGGRVLLFGQQNIHANVEINPTVANQKELQIYGSYAAATSFEDTIRVLSDKRIPLPKLITHDIKLENIQKAFDVMEEGKAMEVLIRPTEGV